MSTISISKNCTLRVSSIVLEDPGDLRLEEWDRLRLEVDGNRMTMCVLSRSKPMASPNLTWDGPTKFSLGTTKTRCNVFGSISISDRIQQKGGEEASSLAVVPIGQSNDAREQPTTITVGYKRVLDEKSGGTNSRATERESDRKKQRTAIDNNSTKQIDDPSPPSENANVAPSSLSTKLQEGNGEADIVAPSAPLSKRQRRKLAKKKEKELEEAVAKINKHEKMIETSKKSKSISLAKERRLPGNVLIKDIVIGGGIVVRPGRRCSILYEGSFPDGKVFDKNFNRKSPLTFRHGTGEIVRGLEKGLAGMRVGGERIITIPPELGYGKRGSADVIPPNATLIFSVQLLRVG